MPLDVGTRLNSYEIVASIGAGGMGEVYRGRDSKLRRDVAIKVLPAKVAGDAERLQRFGREATTLASLNHPGIVTIFGMEESGGCHFIVMELVDGDSLDRLIAPGGMPSGRLIEIAIGLTDALAAAHAKGIVHRDLKPGNVMVTRDGRVKVLDFGLAKLMEEDPGDGSPSDATMLAPLTSDGAIVGTAAYMSPEQLRDDPLDHRTDLFSLGVILHEMATGQRPFTGSKAVDVMSSILRDAPRPLHELNRSLPLPLERVISRCLEKNPRDRPPSALDVRNELRLLCRDAESSGLGSAFTAAVNAPMEIVTLAVLPFADLSPGKDQEYFSDGLAEEMLIVLSKIPDLKVAGRTSSFSFKGKSEDIRVIGERLGVANLLEGSVRKAGDRVRVTAQLVKVEDGFRLWSESYDRTLDDIFAVQDDIAGSVAQALQVTLLGKEGGARRPHPQAYDLVLQAHFVMQTTNEETIGRARKILERALALAPDHAPAWAEKGLLHEREGELATTAEGRQQAFRRGREAYVKALELDPDLAIAHSRLAGVQSASWEFALAIRSTERALAADPQNPYVLHNAANLYRQLGRIEDAISLDRQIHRTDPLNLRTYANLALDYLLAGRLDEAGATCREALELRPEYEAGHSTLALFHLLSGRAEEARSSFARLNELTGHGDHSRLWYEALVEHTAGNAEASAARATEFESRFGDQDPAACAEIRAWRGENDAAFAWLERAVAVRDPDMAYLKTDVCWGPLHADPRWNALLERVGLPTG